MFGSIPEMTEERFQKLKEMQRRNRELGEQYFPEVNGCSECQVDDDLPEKSDRDEPTYEELKKELSYWQKAFLVFGALAILSDFF